MNKHIWEQCQILYVCIQNYCKIPTVDVSDACCCSFGLTWLVLFQTIKWNQPQKAEPVKTSSGPPVCLLTHQSHTHSQSLTTTHTQAPPGVRELRLICTCLLLFFTLNQTKAQAYGSFRNNVVIFISLIHFVPMLSSVFIHGCGGDFFYLLSLSAYRMPRRRFSTGGDEESWSQSLQRVRASLFFICSSSPSD